jgi:rhamnosyltransferase
MPCADKSSGKSIRCQVFYTVLGIGIKIRWNAAMNDGICSVIVTYNRGKRIIATLEQAAAATDYCVIIDNGSSDQTVAIVRDYIAAQPDKFELIEHPVNNLAKAQNLGIRRAKEKGAGWVLLLDHDSIPGRAMVETMRQTYATCSHPEQVAMLVPNLCDKFSARSASYTRHVARSLFFRSGFGKHAVMDDVLVAIASGSLIPMQTFEQIGLMDEHLCIDNVDYDFCLRAIRHRLRIVAVRDAILHHQLGKCRDHRVGGVSVTTTNHHPVRRYYIYRNRLLLWRTHGLSVPAFILFDGCAIAYDLLKITLFEANKRTKIRAIFSGVRDALWHPRDYPMLPADVLASFSK